MNNVIDNYVSVFRNFTCISGRAGRREYWMFFAANFAVCMVLSVMDAALGFPVLGLLYMVAAICPGVAVSVRRLHDGNRSGWWMLIGLIPILGGIALLLIMALPGNPSANRFGQPVEAGDVAFAAA